jgi:hypothetical protein
LEALVLDTTVGQEVQVADRKEVGFTLKSQVLVKSLGPKSVSLQHFLIVCPLTGTSR